MKTTEAIVKELERLDCKEIKVYEAESIVELAYGEDSMLAKKQTVLAVLKKFPDKIGDKILWNTVKFRKLPTKKIFNLWKRLQRKTGHKHIKKTIERFIN